jgi:glutamyl-tRNA reductase
MHILSIGMNHETANVCIREQLAFGEECLKQVLSRFSAGEWAGLDISELVILSTCNRVELYAVSSKPSFEPLEAFLSEVHEETQGKYTANMYHLSDQQAVRHLFQVASGLDSLILGEAQILGQVSSAFELALGKGTAGPILSRLFKAAIFTGKRARTETAIGHNPASIASIAIRLASQSMPDLELARVAVLGAGEMAELAVEALRKRGVARIQVVNRTLQRAKELASRWDGEAHTFDELPLILEQADIVISSTGSPHTLVGREMVNGIMKERLDRPLVIIDIAVPRDIDPDVGELTGVSLYDMDSLEKKLVDSLNSRQLEVPIVEAIIDQEIEVFQNYIDSLDVLPVIAAIHRQAEVIRQIELEKTLRRLPHLSEEERSRIEAMTNALVKKLLSAPLLRLKEQSGGPRSTYYAILARDLFRVRDS